MEKIHKNSRNKKLNITRLLLKRNNEFYTLYDDICKELAYYKNHFKDKIIYCNCDHPKHSQFFMYFALHFWDLGLQKLICSFYTDNDKNIFTSDFNQQYGGYCIYDGYHKDKKLQTKEEIEYFINNDLIIIHFKGSGDFRSEECVNLLIQSDVVVTNPPFSLFRELIMQLVKYNKKFLAIGNFLAIAYIKIFNLYQQKKIFIGINNVNKFDTGNNTLASISCKWFTNLDIPKTYPKFLDTGCSYYENPSLYPSYDFYPAINVDKVCKIPMDYKGLMGVPVSFLYNHNPCQFEIIGISEEIYSFKKKFLIRGKRVFTRLLIKHKHSKTIEHLQPLQLENSLHSQPLQHLQLENSLHSQPLQHLQHLQLENSLHSQPLQPLQHLQHMNSLFESFSY